MCQLYGSKVCTLSGNAVNLKQHLQLMREKYLDCNTKQPLMCMSYTCTYICTLYMCVPLYKALCFIVLFVFVYIEILNKNIFQMQELKLYAEVTHFKFSKFGLV